MTASLCRALLSAFVAIYSFAPVARAVEAVWIGGATDNWSDPANWSTGVVPNLATTDVVIDGNLLQGSVVTLNQNATIQNLFVDAGDAFNIDESRTLTGNAAMIAGDVTIANAGRLVVSDFLWIKPEGRLTSLMGGGFRGTELGSLLWNEGRIEGEGETTLFGFVLANEGTIAANVTNGTLTFALYNSVKQYHYNTGLLMAESGGILSLTTALNPPISAALDNSQGTIEARGDGIVSLDVLVHGGLLTTSSAGGVDRESST